MAKVDRRFVKQKVAALVKATRKLHDTTIGELFANKTTDGLRKAAVKRLKNVTLGEALTRAVLEATTNKAFHDDVVHISEIGLAEHGLNPISALWPFYAEALNS